ncbi:hypothetical protein K7432_016592 [Basidiobolus ranarum]|uniref:F-box domain-containing protein n=1 Tax=Basidiobolus ranarum TaxID=34480 RepID=A0ABR2WEL2_9FUNG
MSVFPQEVLALIFYYHTTPRQLISVCTFFYHLSKQNIIRANWLWRHHDFFGLSPMTSSLVQPHVLITPRVAIILLHRVLQNIHRLQDSRVIVQFLSHLNFQYEFDNCSKLENQKSKDIEELGIVLVSHTSLHSELLMQQLLENFNLSGPAFLDCVLDQVEVGRIQECNRSTLRLIIYACSYRKDEVRRDRAKNLGISCGIFTNRELKVIKRLEEHPEQRKERLLKTLQTSVVELYLFCLYYIRLELEEDDMVELIYNLCTESLRWLYKFGDSVTQDTMRTCKKLLPILAGFDTYWFRSQFESIRFLIEEVYHVDGQLQFEGFDDMLKDTFKAACTECTSIADYLLSEYSLQFDTGDKKQLQRYIINARSSEAFKYIHELDLNASEMLRHILTEDPPICCTEHSYNAVPQYVGQLYLLLEEAGANVAEVFRDFDIANMLVTQPWFLLPGLHLLERHSISVSAADASILLKKTLTSICKYIDRYDFVVLDEVELELLSHLVDKLGARMKISNVYLPFKSEHMW